MVNLLKFQLLDLRLLTVLLLIYRPIYLLHGLLWDWLIGLLLVVLTILLLLSLSHRIQVLLHGHLRHDLLLRLSCPSLDGLVSNQEDTGAGGRATADERLA